MLFIIPPPSINKLLQKDCWFVMDNEVAAGTCAGYNVLSVMIWLHLCTYHSDIYIFFQDGMMLYKNHTFVDKMCSQVFSSFFFLSLSMVKINMSSQTYSKNKISGLRKLIFSTNKLCAFSLCHSFHELPS